MGKETALRFLHWSSTRFGMIALLIAWIVDEDKLFDHIFRFSLAALYPRLILALSSRERGRAWFKVAQKESRGTTFRRCHFTAPFNPFLRNDLQHFFWHAHCSFRSVEAIMNAEREILSACGVEASGWDIAGGFFVEKTALHWLGNDDEEIHLRSPLEEGGVIFLRLLHPGHDTAPIAYRASRVGPRDPEGKSCIHLLPLRRRETHQEELSRWIEQMRVA